MDDTSRSGFSFAVVGILLLLLLAGGGFVWMRHATALREVAVHRAAAAEAAARMAIVEKDQEVARLRQELEALRADASTLRTDAPVSRETLSPEAVADEHPVAAEVGEARLPSPVVTAAHARASAWLQRLHPERYAALTPAALFALAELDLRDCELTDDDLAYLGALPNLTGLELRGTAVTDAGLAQLAALRLQTLSLRGTQVGARNLPMLPATLQHLDLTDTRADADACRFLRPLPDLHTLKLNRLPIDDAGLDALPALPRLRHLEIDGAQVTVAGLERLIQRYPLMARIEVRHVPLAPEALADLARRFPQVELVVYSGAPAGR